MKKEFKQELFEMQSLMTRMDKHMTSREADVYNKILKESIDESDIDEGWKDKAKNALGAAAVTGGLMFGCGALGDGTSDIDDANQTEVMSLPEELLDDDEAVRMFNDGEFKTQQDVVDYMNWKENHPEI